MSEVTVEKLDKACKNYFNLWEEKLNSNTISIDRMPGDLYHIPTVKKLGNYTEADGSQGAFVLEPIDNTIFDEYKKSKDKKQVIIRRVISYNDASKIVNGLNPKNILLPIIYEMVKTLEKVKKFNYNTLNAGSFYGTFIRPGASNSFFREDTSSLGFELRLYSDSWKADETE